MADLYGLSVGTVGLTDPSLVAGGADRRDTIVAASRNAITESGVSGYYYNPGPGYSSGYWPRDVLYMLEAGATISVADQRAMLDWLLSKQLGSFNGTYPAGSIPDHITANGQVAWGPGDYYGILPAGRLNNRPSMDTNVCVQQLAWLYGKARSWDSTWQTWFSANSTKLVAAYNAIPRSGDLVTQYSTNPASTWGFLDCINLTGASISVSVLSCNAARALSDMYGRANGAANQATWAATAAAVQAAIQATFTTDAYGGFLKWTSGGNADVMSPDITAYAACSGILSSTQAAQASAWLNWRYILDKASGGAGDVFTFANGCHGGIRQRRVANNSSGSACWATFFLTPANNTYQNGGYWYYMSGAVAATLAISHPDTAAEFLAAAVTDMLASTDGPFERSDRGTTPANGRYNASATSIAGQSTDAVIASTYTDHSMATLIEAQQATFTDHGVSILASNAAAWTDHALATLGHMVATYSDHQIQVVELHALAVATPPLSKPVAKRVPTAIILDTEDRAVCVLSNGSKGLGVAPCRFKDDCLTEDLTGVLTWEATAQANHADSTHLVEENHVLVRGDDDEWRYLTIKTTDDVGTTGIWRTVHAENAAQELNGRIVRPVTYSAWTPEDIATDILAGERWEVGQIDWAGGVTLAFKELPSKMEAIRQLAEASGLEVKWRVEFNGSRITRYVLDMVTRLGRDRHVIFEYRKSLRSVKRTVDTTPLVTRMIGAGKADSQGNFVSFKNVVWSKAGGDPCDKAAGLDYIQDDDAVARWGVIEGVYSNPDIVSGEALIHAAWSDPTSGLAVLKDPAVTYECDPVLLKGMFARMPGQSTQPWEDEDSQLGDTVYVKDYRFDPPLLTSQRVCEVKRGQVKKTPRVGAS